MLVTLVRPFKNHNVGEVLDVSKRVYDHLRKMKCTDAPKRRSKPVKEKKEKAHEKPPADRQVKGSPQTK